MKRKIMDKLLEWRNNPLRKSLIIQGARQVGKTYSVREFAKNNYPSSKIIEINFERFPEANTFFEGDLSPDVILRKLQNQERFSHIDFKVSIQEPLFIFLDEIQMCPNAITALKFFTEEKSQYHVIASGSLLGVALRQKNVKMSYPVGYVDHLTLTPFDFEEFMWANGYTEEYVNRIKETFYDTSSLTKGAHDGLLDLFRKFIVIGGLPEPINVFVKTKNYAEVYKTQQNLKIGYMQDIEKYADDNSTKIKIKKCFDSIPTHLKEQNKKFKYKAVEKNGRARMFEGALDWLSEAGLAIFCDNIKKVEEPLETYRMDDSFKLFLFDTGILMSMFPEDKRYKVLNGSEDLDIGGIYENAVACILANYHRGNKIMYFHDPDVLEIDFVTRNRNVLLAVEVKSGENLSSSSLNKFAQQKHQGKMAFIKTSGKLVSKDENKIINIPLYSFALIGTTDNSK